MIGYLLAAHRGKVIAGVIVLAVLTAFAILGIVLPSGHGPPPHIARAAAIPAGIASANSGTGAKGSTVLSPQELTQLDAAPTVAPATSPLLPSIAAPALTQPDLYAQAFVAALFTHAYAGVTRDEMLAWVQAQQAASTYITGGTPGLRNRLLVESASDPAWSNHGFAAVPDEATWEQASAGRMSARIDRLICITPPEWEAAITAGVVTDPGLTERLVSGDLTMTLTQDGRRATQKVSVALTLLLEGPPTAVRYGVIVIADTSVVEVP